MKIISYKIFAALILILFASSCSKEILDEKPPHIITTETLYTTLAGFETGLNGLYALVRQEKESGSGTEYRGLLFMHGTDNLVTNHSTAGLNELVMYWGEHNNPFLNTFDGIFTWLYSIINAANTIIKNAEERNDIDWSGGPLGAAVERNRVIAEARFIRGWAYRHLTYGWGDVPLTLEESSGGNIRTDWFRTPVTEVREQIVEDLLFAEAHISVEPYMQGRISLGAVQHYLAEMYLVMNDPEKALGWANKVINNPAYQLITSRYGVNSDQPGVAFMDMFTYGNENRESGNTEALWVFPFEHYIVGGGSNNLRRAHNSRYRNIRFEGVRPLTQTYERGGHGVSRASITKWAFDIYEPHDDRFSEHAIRKFFVLKDAQMNAPFAADRLPPGYEYGDTIWNDWSQDITFETRARDDWPWSRKVDDTDPDNITITPGRKDFIYVRLAETYLLKAEAEYLLERPGDAAETINIIRRRSNASEISAADVDIDFILDERSRELILEEHRRWTLLRTGKLVARTREYNNNGGQNITERDTIFPIPQSVIDANLTVPMPQNPGFN